MRLFSSLIATTALLLPLAAAQGWPASDVGASASGHVGPVSRNCEDLSDEPITYGMQYDLPGTGLPDAPIDIHDVWLAGGCVGCHNQTAMGELRLDDPQFAGYQLVSAVSFRNPELLRVDPGKPENSLLYAQLNCTPPDTYPLMPPPDDGVVTRVPRRLRALVYDWIQQGARGFDVDGNPYSLTVFRDSMESTRGQFNLARPGAPSPSYP
ncbi:c-type cytochrome domain-containing protein [uncultured Aquimonas sp.]|uniref:c-type cytochrome domain-containing protein n=1 Tax=uncultured Aquimonas sp. TaxID=385483 RepID=UPI00086E8F73|nr:c-type cytochrome domain-containing protein [uncultured Aquimonas sp.]ODU43481.1 MAG: hypothetical protein ABS96_22875 [Xanthomonadaceae bacterium SCN 69-123]